MREVNAVKLNIISLLSEGALPKEGNLVFDPQGWDIQGFEVQGPVKMRYKAVPRHQTVELETLVEASLAGSCARCLDAFSQHLKVRRKVVIRESDLHEVFPELPYTPAGELDLQEFAYQELVLEAPAVPLCSEECPGLCQNCGRKKADCNCGEKPEGDPRWQILKQFEFAGDE